MDNKPTANAKGTADDRDIIEIDDSFVIVSSDDESLQMPKEEEQRNVASPTKEIIGLQSQRLRNYQEVVELLNRFKLDNTIEELLVLFTCHDVRLYLNHPNGIVDLIHNNATLRVIHFDETPLYHLSFCLQIVDTIRNAEFIYPLDKDHLQCYYTSYGAFILPQLQVQQREHGGPDGITYGLVIPKPADDIIFEILQDILIGKVKEIPRDVVEARPGCSSAIMVSDSIVKNSYYISSGMVKGAEKAGEYIGKGAILLKTKLDPSPSNQQAVIPEKFKAAMEVTKSVTGTAVNITGKCASALGTATMALGRYLAPHIKQKLPPLLTHGFGINPETSEQSVNDALALAGGAVEGVSNIYTGIEQSATIIGKNVANNVVQIIEHKYGENYGSIATTTFDTAGNVINISQNVNFMTPKGLVKKTAKGASIAIVKEYNPNTNMPMPSTEQELYPDLSGLIKELENDRLKKME